MRKEGIESKDKIVHTVCNSHCGGTCDFKVHVREGKIIRIESVPDEDGRPGMCLRGHAYRQRVYSPDRLLHPLKRTGERGSGEFTRISWDEALDTVAGEMKRIKEAYGNASLLHFCSMCDPHVLHHVGAFHSLLCQFGGYTAPWGYISCEGYAFAEGLTFGKSSRLRYTGHTPEEYLEARLIIMWGWNPATTEMGSNMSLSLARARERGARIIAVDPRYTDSAAAFADQWIPIRPGTDAAVMLAMAYVIIKENLQDQHFIDSHTSGFDKFKDYVLGLENGEAKTPQWAEAISGIQATTIADLARDYACENPAILGNSFGPGRSAFGEQYHRTAAALQTITGNLRLEHYAPSVKDFRFVPPFPFQPNQVEVGAPPRWNALPSRGPSVNSSARLNVSSLTDAILKGKAGGYPADYKFMWLSNNNYLNQLGNVNKAIEAFNKLEFILVTEQFMTATARFADIVLPVCTFLERWDLMPSVDIFSTKRRDFTILQKAIEPLGESRSQLEICQALALKLGITDYPDQSDEELVRQMVAKASEKKGLKPEETSKTGPSGSVQPQLRTPSGKVELSSGIAEKMNHPHVPAIPKYIETWESLNDPLADKYPLQLISPHFKRRAHSQFDNLPWLRELQVQAISINSRDAETRGIQDGDMVRVFNDRGETRIPAKVTERIMPGVVALPQGAWYTPDENGIDHGGSPNILTRSITSPGGSFPSHTALVQVEKE
ncbi:MAG: molybdopterin-dependent oxidoreductase [Deltaproteobacteria bacterium]|nr:molybdopterin-dependent oxidoreductase [Deltaproteobacteria bacterium]